ncbi:MAG: hypothetical protein K2W33_12060, partial [Burkholderiales bacterium]|nr:hypothetical protein [Burkholderiales bacterium]
MQARDMTVRWVAALGAVLALGGSAWLVATEWQRLRSAFDTQARIIHRLLSQQMVQHEAVLSTLTLLPPAPDVAVPLTAVYPHIRQVQVMARVPVQRADTADAPGHSTTPLSPPPQPQVTLASAHWASGRYSLTAVGPHSTVSMDIDLTQWVHPPEWPEPSAQLPLSVDLVLGQQVFVLQPPNTPSWEWQLAAGKAIASASQPFNVITRTHLTWAHVP